MYRRASPDPAKPLKRDDLHHVGQALAPPLRSLCDPEVEQSPGLVQRRLHCGPAATGQCRDLVDRKVADTVMLALACYDGEHGHLPERVMTPEVRRKHGRPAEHASSFARGLALRV